MKFRYFIIILISLISSDGFGQNTNEREIFEIVRIVVNSINPQIPIVDSLHVFSLKRKFLRKEIQTKASLNKKQKRILKNGIKNDFGLLIDKDLLNEFKFYEHKQIRNAFINGETEYIIQKRPFYFISKPLIFREINVAIINVDLIGGYGTTFVLKKENERWKIIGEVGRWYS
jgi:hypothetical protein